MDLTVAEAKNARIREMLHSRARKSAKSLKWNGNVLVLAYAVLTISVILAIEAQSSLFVAMIAIPGLIIVWAFSSMQEKQIEKRLLEDEMRMYKELLEMRPARLRESQQQTISAEEMVSPLSARELDVLSQIAKGDSNKEAALALSISEQTVKNHLKNIFGKLEVRDRTSAILTALRNGWIQRD